MYGILLLSAYYLIKARIYVIVADARSESSVGPNIIESKFAAN